MNSLPPATQQWVWPRWFEYRTEGALEARPVNRSRRNWTRVGVLGPGPASAVDERGLVSPDGLEWCLDWWVGAGDRWRFPSRENAVRQSLFGEAPIVQTSMRIPRGDAIELVYEVAGAHGLPELVIEVTNSSPMPFALAICLRPFTLESLGALEELRIEGERVLVDGAPRLVLPSVPRQCLMSNLAGGDVAERLIGAVEPTDSDSALWCPDAGATAALVWPLASGTSLAVNCLLGPQDEAAPGVVGGASSASPARISSHAGSLADSVARSWAIHLRRRPRIELPPGPLAAAMGAARAHLASMLPDGSRPRDEEALVVSAIASAGFEQEAGSVLEEWSAELRSPSAAGDTLSAAATIWALCRFYSLAGDRAVSREQLLVLGETAEQLAFTRRRERLPETGRASWRSRRAGTAGAAGTEVALVSLWCAAAWQSAAGLLARSGEAGAAVALWRWAGAEIAGLSDRGALEDRSEGTSEAKAGGVSGFEAALLLGCSVLGVLTPGDRLAEAADKALRRSIRPAPGGLAVVVGDELGGASPYLTALAVGARAMRWQELQIAGPVPGVPGAGGLDRLTPAGVLGGLVAAASPTWTWPDRSEAGSGAGIAGQGHSALATAGFWWAATSLLAHLGPEPSVLPEQPGLPESPPRLGRRGRLAAEPRGKHAGADLILFSWVPPWWFGHGVEVDGLMLAGSEVSFALRWHGERPALLWQMRGGPQRTVRAPGLDPGWSSDHFEGEALLAPLERPSSAAAEGPGRRPV